MEDLRFKIEAAALGKFEGGASSAPIYSFSPHFWQISASSGLT